MMRLLAVTLFSLVCAEVAVGQGTLNVGATVRESCEVDFTPVTIAQIDDSVSTTAFENCNNGNGFVVRAHHRPLEPGETAQLIYANEVVDLSNGSQTDVIVRTGAKFGEQKVALEAIGLQADLNITLAAAPLS
ncbi:MAG: hypothetical protein WA989_14110 [Henriciella sp.]|uniref:hypothetical protein n=1 Tax=Henriciella sp. TaxID=1968823 RepID=UPI003C757ABD